jgi:hypothetical protein
MEMGGKFWLWLVAVLIGVGAGTVLLFMLFGRAWYAWGLFGALLVFSAVAIGIAWVFDRRDQQRRKSLAA